MRIIIIFVCIIFMVSVMVAENPASENYILQQSSFSSGNDPANPPTSTNYILEGSTIGEISSTQATSANYNSLAGYYLGELFIDILPPQNVTISVSGTLVQLTWNAVSGANSYKVFSSADPYAGFVEDTTGTFAGESWNTPIPAEKMFYYVKAVN